MKEFLGKIRNNERLKTFALAALCAAGVVLYLDTFASEKAPLGGTVMIAPITYGYYFIIRKATEVKSDTESRVVSIILSILYAGFLNVGAQMDSWSTLIVNLKFVVKVILLAAAIYPLLLILTRWLDEKREKMMKSHGSVSGKCVPICFGIIAVIWFLGYLALFPGVYGVDAPTWFNMWNNPGDSVTSQWSVLLSWFFWFCVKIGEGVFGSRTVGCGIFTLVQMCFVLFVIYKILRFLEKEVGRTPVIIASTFFALVPTHMILSISTTQDMWFAACFAMVCIELIRMAKEPAKYWGNLLNPARLYAWMFFGCVFRNNGIYAIFAMTVLMLFYVRKYRIRLAAVVLMVFVGLNIYQGPIFSLLDVQKGPALREMLSIPLQQMGAAYNDDKLSSEIKAEMEEYLSADGWKAYFPEISDSLKNYIDMGKVQGNLGKFVKLYVKVGAASPESYVKAVLWQTFGLWYADKNYPDDRMWHPYINYICIDAKIIWSDGALDIQRHSLLPLYEKVLGKLYGQGDDASGCGNNLSLCFDKVPFLAMFCKIGTYFAILCYLFLYSIIRRQRGMALPMLLCLGVTATVLLAPLICYRYYCAVIFSMPLVLAALFIKSREAQTKKEGNM